MKRILGLAVLWLTGCAAHLPPCVRDGGPAWHELASEHVRLRTDLHEDEARAIVRDLERLRAALLGVFHAPPGFTTGALPVIVLNEGWNDVADGTLVGYLTRDLFRPLLVMRREGARAETGVIIHELVHYFSRLLMPNQPRWFSEGLATYFETLSLDDEKGQVSVGRPQLAHLLAVQRYGLLSLEELDAGTPLDTNRYYASAWLTVHYLMNHEPEALLRYEDALREELPLSEAWKMAFGTLTPSELSERVRRYMDGGDYALLTFRLPPLPPAPVTARVLSDAETHATRAQLLVHGGHGPQREARVDRQAPEVFLSKAKAEVAEALRQEPRQVFARALAAFDLDETLDVTSAREAVQQQPGDWMAWLLLAKALQQHGITAGRAEAAAEGARLQNQDPSVWRAGS